VRTLSRDDGFTLMELLIATTITLIVLAGAMTTFKQALAVNDVATQTADSSQNLRAGTNLLVRDLMQSGRLIPIGGISIPNGTGATPLNRPSPPNNPGQRFTNTGGIVNLPAIIPGSGLGPTIDGQTTDMITMLMSDPIPRGDGANGQHDTSETAIELKVGPQAGGIPYISTDGSSFNVGSNTDWISGDPVNGVPPMAAGDLIMFTANGGYVLGTVTRVDATHVFMDAGDWFNFNQSGTADAGTVAALLTTAPAPATVNAQRIYMITYYVDALTTPGTPRLARVENAGTAQALAGVVEDLDFTYDFVDGVTNPANQPDVPTGSGLSANQIRKVNVHVGVRSERMTAPQHDYMRNHLSTVVAIRNLAWVDRYQ